VSGKICAHFFDLFCEVSEESCCFVGTGIVVEVDQVDEGPGVDSFGELRNLSEALSLVVISQAVPNDKGKRSIVVIVVLEETVGRRSRDDGGADEGERGN
jgi:hypothetical protein